MEEVDVLIGRLMMFQSLDEEDLLSDKEKLEARLLAMTCYEAYANAFDIGELRGRMDSE